MFWKLLYASGLTTRLCVPSEDKDMPGLFSYGLTNIVTRPTRDASMLKREEMEAGVAVLEEKTRECRPEAVCLVGKGIWESVAKVWRGKKLRKEEFKYGWQKERMGAVKGEWQGAKVFVATTTSGLAAGMSYAEKLEIWSELGVWVRERRVEREINERTKEAGVEVAAPTARMNSRG